MSSYLRKLGKRKHYKKNLYFYAYCFHGKTLQPSENWLSRALKNLSKNTGLLTRLKKSNMTTAGETFDKK